MGSPVFNVFPSGLALFPKDMLKWITELGLIHKLLSGVLWLVLYSRYISLSYSYFLALKIYELET